MGKFTQEFKQVKRTVLNAASDTITLGGLRGLKNFYVTAKLINSGSIIPIIRFNNDSGNNYADRLGGNGGADITTTAASSIRLASAAVAQLFAIHGFIYGNGESTEKLFIGWSDDAAGETAATAPSRREIVGKWVNTVDGIDRIDIINTDTGDFAAGSEVIVHGLD